MCSWGLTRTCLHMCTKYCTYKARTVVVDERDGALRPPANETRRLALQAGVKHNTTLVWIGTVKNDTHDC